MPFIPTHLPGVMIFEPKIFEDNRGYFFESYNASTLAAEGFEYHFVQDNQSFSKYGVIRGLHFQLPPHAQTKLVRAVQGTVLDVAVDIREGSPTYGQHVAVELSATNRKQLLIPAGFAHGFSVLSETAELFYKCDRFYNKESDGGILFNDPVLEIDWKIPSERVIVSDKDRHLPTLATSINNFVYES